MTPPRSLPQQYLTLTARWRRLVRHFEDETSEGESLASRMDIVWYAMTVDEQEEAKRLLREEAIA